MFGSKIASRVIRDHLLILPEVIAIGTAKVVGLPVLPQSVPLPGIAFYPEQMVYSGPIGGRADSITGRVVIKAMCEGTTTSAIDTVALAIYAHFADLTVDTTYEGAVYQLTFDPNSELLPTAVVDDGRFYRQLGTVFNITIT